MDFQGTWHKCLGDILWPYKVVKMTQEGRFDLIWNFFFSKKSGILDKSEDSSMYIKLQIILTLFFHRPLAIQVIKFVWRQQDANQYSA
jgi:hypothetical protein